MATISTSQFGNSYCPIAQLEVTQSASTDTTATLSWTLKWVTYGYTVTSSVGVAYIVKINGTEVKNSTFAHSGKTSQTIASGTVTIGKSTVALSIPFSLYFGINWMWNYTQGSAQTVSGSITIAATTSYTIAYNANGGSGAPSSQTKWYGTALTLSTTKPTRTGYTFSKWNTNSSGSGTSYAAGASYTANAAATLYAIWTANTYTVSYDANGGSGAPSSQTKTYGTALTLSSTKPTRTGYTFKGWATSASGSVAYAAGASYTANASVTLYAVWELAYTLPEITNLKAQRCTSSGTADETGTYAKVTFSWTTCTVSGNTATLSKYTIVCNSVTTSVTGSGSSGSVSKVIGSGALSADSSYTITVTLTDSKSGVTSKSLTLPTSAFIIDFKSGGTGVAIGKVAATDNLLDIALPAKFNNTITVSYSDIPFYHKHSTSGASIGFGVGEGGSNKGIYDGNAAKWLFKTGSSGDITLGPPNYSEYTPYYKAGDSFTLTTIRTAGLVTGSGKNVYFIVPLDKPVLGSPTVTATSTNGFIFRQDGNYTHGSSASTGVTPSAMTVTLRSTYLQINASFSTTTNVINNDATSIEASLTITFS